MALLKGPGRLRLLGLVAVIGVCCLGFAVLADEVVERETQSFDETVVRSLRRTDDPRIPVGPKWLLAAARDVTSLGSGTVLALITVGVCGFLMLIRRFRSLLLVAGSTVGGALVNSLLKHFFARPRPSVVPHLAEAFAPSFPSGHAMLSAIVYLTLGALLSELTERSRLKAYVLGMAVLLSFLVGLTRVYLGVHYLTDIIGGWMMGLAWALLTVLLVRGAKRTSPALRDEVRKGASGPEEMPPDPA
ncbi:phosphatase PAP2 family protein [Stigmatella aurantiaca]|uniref:Membrane-associated phospholipid phosphatase n=1 Tax=Stigmatella aurantiaca (strain DW4/3-1) TaxID=378806 RepID=Q08QK8_STIAD|nr:phosphatase PAP2 family protein [Stigmatella aurantiaca]ADO75544.1 Phosphatidic acid phosphatase type 2/haloperoxidase family protein [Stigmatella aurantiaca DW4/3-1]EAU62760.1 membrane-associated phospholipid phosphatase [Stigmatella aurantiaca DW4/3-1]